MNIPAVVDESITSNELFQLKHKCLEIRDGIEFDGWIKIGYILHSIRVKSYQWWLGDWLVYGESAYGEKYKEAANLTGYRYQTLNDFNWVASTFEISRRREILSWSHHKEVASLEPDVQDELLDLAEEKQLGIRALREKVKERKNIQTNQGTELDKSPEEVEENQEKSGLTEQVTELVSTAIAFCDDLVLLIEGLELESQDPKRTNLFEGVLKFREFVKQWVLENNLQLPSE